VVVHARAAGPGRLHRPPGEKLGPVGPEPGRPRLRMTPEGGFSSHRVWGGEFWVRTAVTSCFPLEARNLESIFAGGADVRLHRGRGRCYSTRLGPGIRAVLRHYRHGGTLAPL